FADCYFDQRGFALDAISAQQPTGKQRIAISWIPRYDPCRCQYALPYGRATAPRTVDDLKHRRVLDPGNRFLRHSLRNRIIRVEFDAQDRSGYIEIRAWQTVDHVADRQLELFDR